MTFCEQTSACSLPRTSSNIMAICELHGKTNHDMSNACGVSEDEVENWKDGSKCIPFDAIVKLSQMMNVTVDGMMQGKWYE